ncbi:hypothetical protein [Blastomonas sp. UPD001]|uniref:hypothetical protein n=1 Tax=Blastomonas sp. UPD001 TaxID=2217673 RepID=UPI000E34F7DB|nr:hypothetical protein [Blastomonas sp. UPD001]
MSFSKEDRKVQSKTGKTFPPSIKDEPLAIAIAAALREEFGDTPSALKTIARLTRSNERAVRNWFEGKNSPSAANLVILMRNSDRILRTVLTLADRHDLVVAAGLAGLRRQLLDAVAAIDGLPVGGFSGGSHNSESDTT